MTLANHNQQDLAARIVVCELDPSSSADERVRDAIAACEEHDAALHVVWAPRAGAFVLPAVLATALELAAERGIPATSAVRFGQDEVVLRTVDGRPQRERRERLPTRARISIGAGLVLATSVLAPVAQAASAANGRGGFGWVDLVFAVAVLAGIVLLGLYGDVVVGAVVFGVAALIEMGAALCAQAVRSVTRPRRGAAERIAGTRGVSAEARLR